MLHHSIIYYTRMFIDELEIYAKAGNGGDGVVRWRREKHRPNGGPAGGNGGDGGDVYIRAVRNLNVLSKYVGATDFYAENGQPGSGGSKHGPGGKDCSIDLPIGSTVTDLTHGRVYTLDTEGALEKVLNGGTGGLGNEYFKSSTNRSPRQHTKGTKGEDARFRVELSLIVDVGLIGLPNAGKSTLLNALTHAHSKIGAYPFTTLEPHLGDFHGYILADIPGLIEGASEGKGLGHKFLKHVTKTRMLLHCVSLEQGDPLATYQTIRDELARFDTALTKKEELTVLTKADLVDEEYVKAVTDAFKKEGIYPIVTSSEDESTLKNLSQSLSKMLQK